MQRLQPRLRSQAFSTPACECRPDLAPKPTPSSGKWHDKQPPASVGAARSHSKRHWLLPDAAVRRAAVVQPGGPKAKSQCGDGAHRSLAQHVAAAAAAVAVLTEPLGIQAWPAQASSQSASADALSATIEQYANKNAQYGHCTSEGQCAADGSRQTHSSSEAGSIALYEPQRASLQAAAMHAAPQLRGLPSCQPSAPQGADTVARESRSSPAQRRGRLREVDLLHGGTAQVSNVVLLGNQRRASSHFVSTVRPAVWH